MPVLCPIGEHGIISYINQWLPPRDVLLEQLKIFICQSVRKETQAITPNSQAFSAATSKLATKFPLYSYRFGIVVGRSKHGDLVEWVRTLGPVVS
jgi:hypothetical protein